MVLTLDFYSYLIVITIERYPSNHHAIVRIFYNDFPRSSYYPLNNKITIISFEPSY